EEREAARMVRVDELVARRRRVGEDPEPAERILALERAQHRSDRGPADAVEAVAAGDHVAVEPLLRTLVLETDVWRLGVEVVDAHVRDLEQERQAAREPVGDQILHDLRLAVDDDAAAAGELAQRDVVTLARELEVDAVMDDVFPAQ